MSPLSQFQSSASRLEPACATSKWRFRSILRVLAIAVVSSGGLNMGWAQQIEWVHQFGTEGYDDGTDVAGHSTGVYAVGRVQGALPGQAARGLIDGYVRKYDFYGTEIWTRQFSFDRSMAEPFAIAVDDDGVFVAGRLAGRSLGKSSESGQCNGFVAKYDHSGNLIWTHFSMIEAWGLALDPTSVYVAGDESGAAGSTALVGRLDRMGNEIWTATAGTPFMASGGLVRGAHASGIAVDATGVYVSGTLGTADVRRFDFDGNVIGEFGLGTIDGGLPENLAIDASGIYVSGTLCPPLCQLALVVRKYDRGGNELWTSYAPDDVLTSGDLAIDEHGVYLTGNLDNNDPCGPFFAYVRRYDTDGEIGWTYEIGPADGYNSGQGLTAHAGKLYLTGFTSGTFPGQTATPQQDAFVVKLRQPTAPRVLSDILPGALDFVIPVAIFTTAEFDAGTIDPLSVRFGPAGAIEAHGQGHWEDVDGDGDTDLVLHFETPATGNVCGDTEASFTGRTFAGEPILGSDKFVTVGCG
jgi:hypothetical protein